MSIVQIHTHRHLNNQLDLARHQLSTKAPGRGKSFPRARQWIIHWLPPGSLRRRRVKFHKFCRFMLGHLSLLSLSSSAAAPSPVCGKFFWARSWRHPSAAKWHHRSLGSASSKPGSKGERDDSWLDLGWKMTSVVMGNFVGCWFISVCYFFKTRLTFQKG